LSDSPSLIPIPGGMARLREPDELTTRHDRGYQDILLAFGFDRYRQLVDSKTALDAADTGRNDEETFAAAVAELQLDYREAALLSRMTDALIYKWVKEIKAPGVRTPGSVDEVQDLPKAVYAALANAAGKRQAETEADDQSSGFAVGSAGDPESPSGASSA